MRSFSYLLAAPICLTACSSSGTAPSATTGTDGSLTPSRASAPPLVGTWESKTNSDGGLGTTFLFSPEGTVTLVVGAMVSGKYRLEGNQLTLNPEGPGPELPEVQTLTFAGDTAVIGVGPMKRKLIPFAAKAQPNSLVGQWRFMHSAGLPAYEEYTNEGTMRLRVPMQVAKGLYSIRGNTMKMRLLSPHMEERAVRFTVKGDTLRLISPSGTLVFERAEPLLPTDLQQPTLPIR